METWGNKVKKALSRLNKVNNYLYNKPEQEWTHQDKALAISFLRKSKVAENMEDLQKIKEFFSKDINEQADHVDPMVAKAYKDYIKAKKDSAADIDFTEDPEKAYRYYSRKLNNTYSSRADRDAIEAILKKKYGSAMGESVNENFAKFDILKMAVTQHEKGAPYYDKTRLINIFNQLSSSDQVKAKKQYSGYFGESVNEGPIEDIQKKLDTLGVKYEMSKTDKVRPFKVIYKPTNKSDEFYNKFEDIVDLYNLGGVVKTSMNEVEKEDPTDLIVMDVPLFIRMLEYAREDAETDMDLHDVTERAIEATKLRGILSMEDYQDIIGEPIEEETGYSKFLATPENPQGKTPGLTPDIMNKILMKIATMGDDDVEETTRLGEGVIYEELCPKGKAYIKKRQAAGEKSSAYLSGRAVKVCKGQMKG